MTSDDENVLDFQTGKDRYEVLRKEQAAKDLRKRFQQAMGWKSKPKKVSGSKGPKPKRGKKR